MAPQLHVLGLMLTGLPEHIIKPVVTVYLLAMAGLISAFRLWLVADA